MEIKSVITTDVMFQFLMLLRENGIDHEIAKDSSGYMQVYIFDDENIKYSVICNPHSYGYPKALEIGQVIQHKHGNAWEVEGFLSPEDALNIIKNNIDLTVH